MPRRARTENCPLLSSIERVVMIDMYACSQVVSAIMAALPKPILGKAESGSDTHCAVHSDL